MTGEGLKDVVVQFAGNIFIAMAAIGAVRFVLRREFVRFAEFIVLALAVATFVYTPEVWVGVARTLAAVIGADSANAAP